MSFQGGEPPAEPRGDATGERVRLRVRVRLGGSQNLRGDATVGKGLEVRLWLGVRLG
jgi:hypothetical protein